MSSRTPATTAARKEESYRNQWWYPSRCELPGCESTGQLLRCSGCCMVKYCGQEHQMEDWAAHKKDEEMLARFPLQPRPPRNARGWADAPRPPAGAPCPLCLRRQPEVGGIKVAYCCGRPVCDDSEGDMCGIDRAYCCLCHDRYTHCGYHTEESACDATKDWRECRNCMRPRGGPYDVADFLWRGLNNYNHCPLLSQYVPPHSLCVPCDGCKKLFIPCVEGCVRGRRGVECPQCNPY